MAKRENYWNYNKAESYTLTITLHYKEILEILNIDDNTGEQDLDNPHTDAFLQKIFQEFL